MIGQASTDDTVQLLFLSVEHAGMPDVQAFVQNIHGQGRLSRIVIDESHLALSWSDFRPSMFALKGLRMFPVPLLLLSATVPPSMEQDLRFHFGSNFRTIRQSTVRPELKYEVQEVDEARMDRAIVDALYQTEDDLEDGRAIVFCLQKVETSELADKINERFGTRIAATYHGDMDASDRKISQDEWMSGSTVKVMVATKAFGMGIDCSNIRLIVHKGQSSSILDYAQETGRAGRDGCPSRCLTITNDKYSKQFIDHPNSNKAQKQQRQELLALLKVGDFDIPRLI
jgi:superfamily II DNA helicase RecQ